MAKVLKQADLSAIVTTKIKSEKPLVGAALAAREAKLARLAKEAEEAAAPEEPTVDDTDEAHETDMREVRRQQLAADVEPLTEEEKRRFELEDDEDYIPPSTGGEYTDDQDDYATEDLTGSFGLTVNGKAVTAYVSGDEFLNDGDDDDDTEIEKVVQDVVNLDFMIEYLTSHELDPRKRDQLFNYLTLLPPEQIQTLWEAFCATYGADINSIEAIDKATKLINSVEMSKSLAARNKAAQVELSRFGTVYQQLARTMRISASDMPMGTLRVDDLSKSIEKYHRDLTLMNSAVLEMAQMLLVDHADGEAVDMAINPERAAKICAIVGYSAKGWSKVSEIATKDKLESNREIETLKQALKVANESAAHANAVMTAEKHKIDALIVKADNYTIRNMSGNFLSTVNAQEGDFFRVTPFNLRVTQDKEQALFFDDIEVARKVFDAVTMWSTKNRRVIEMLSDFGVNPTTLFIAAESMTKVL